MNRPDHTICCYDYCLKFQQANPKERVAMLIKYRDCTICLKQDQDKAEHRARTEARNR